MSIVEACLIYIPDKVIFKYDTRRPWNSTTLKGVPIKSEHRSMAHCATKRPNLIGNCREAIVLVNQLATERYLPQEGTLSVSPLV